MLKDRAVLRLRHRYSANSFAIATLQTVCLAVIRKLDTFANGYFTAALLRNDAAADLDCEQNVYW